MRTYAFRLICKLAGGDIETKEREILLVLPALIAPIKVFLPKGESPPEDKALVLWCGGFTSEVAAQAAGASVKTAMMLAGVTLGIGIDVGTDQAISFGWQRQDGQPDERLQPNVHGLQVVPDLEGMLFGGIQAGRLVLC
jgi:hypothetical protein